MDFMSLDLGTAKPSVVPYDTIHVSINPEVMVDGYARALRMEAERMNPLTFDRVKLEEEELQQYFRFLLYQRVLSTRGECVLWRQLKALWIPTFLQFALSMVGDVKITDRGIHLLPIMSDPGVKYETALAISDKLSYFEQDLAMVKDAMPRSPEGDVDTMSSALIADYMKSLNSVEHHIATYCAAFMGFKIQEEQAFEILYRVQYDHIDRLRALILQSTEVRGRNES